MTCHRATYSWQSLSLARNDRVVHRTTSRLHIRRGRTEVRYGNNHRDEARVEHRGTLQGQYTRGIGDSHRRLFVSHLDSSTGSVARGTPAERFGRRSR